MVTIEHGDMVEQRRGGVDVLRILVRNLALHEQSGAVCIQAASGNEMREGWLLFRLGQPVMAFYQGKTTLQGLEALLSIEEDALDVGNELRLYELTMNALRSTMAEHPDSVLHLEYQEHREATASETSVREDREMSQTTSDLVSELHKIAMLVALSQPLLGWTLAGRGPAARPQRPDILVVARLGRRRLRQSGRSRSRSLSGLVVGR